jgi:hypothetical protein
MITVKRTETNVITFKREKKDTIAMKKTLKKYDNR